MKSFLAVVISTLFCIDCFCQDIRTIDKKLVCEAPKKLYGNTEPVATFKDNLHLKIQVDKITVGT
ncbi:MAG: hypothetical protein K0S12_2132, partial [Bacteroidetes bacterium]|nr:hypothetical protein [Bacteroidota bacterium]